MEIIDSVLGFVLSWRMILTILVLWLLVSSIFIVRGKTAGILETFGKPHDRARLPGLQFKLPWPFTAVRARVNLQLQEIEANVSVKTKDNAFMTLPVKVQYRASDDPVGAVKAHYELEKPEAQITSYVLNNVRQTASGMDMVELYANRDSMENQVQTALSERFARYGYIIENVLVDEPQPSREVHDAFNRVIASQRLKEAAENEAAAARIKLVGVAEAESKSKELQGEGMAKMREAMAKGLENAMETMTKAGLTPQEAMAFLTETNRLDTISNAAAHGNMVIVDTRSGGDMTDTVAAVKAATAQPRPVSTPKAA
jgi:regulator of protease activity HflC (stomatin/prohibitin superfamily)